MKVNLVNLRERVIDGLCSAFESKPVSFVIDRPRLFGATLSLVMAAFYFGFVARERAPVDLHWLGIVSGVVFVGVAVFCCWLSWYESRPRANKGEPPMPIPPAPSRHWPPRPDWMPALGGEATLTLPELPGPKPLGKLEPSPDWPHHGPRSNRT
jgi:hypothetical protein